MSVLLRDWKKQRRQPLSYLFIIFFSTNLFLGCGAIHSKMSSTSSSTSDEGSLETPPQNPGENLDKSPETPSNEKGTCQDLLSDSFQTKREEVCQIVAEERIKRGTTPLELDPELSLVAQEYAKEMAEKNFFSHTSPAGEDPGDRLRRHNVRNNGWGENIALGQASSISVMKSWMNSSGHRANILDRNFDKMGVGFYKTYWVQVFVTE